MNPKKRTVWFLTLLSLGAVFSVYVLNDRPDSFDGIVLFEDEVAESDAAQPVSYPVNETFQEMRMEVEAKRSQLREQLTQKIGSPEFTAEEKNAAYEELELLTNQDSTEALLELVISSLGYPEALVRIEQDQVMVNVAAEMLAPEEANSIIYAVKKNIQKQQKFRLTTLLIEPAKAGFFSSRRQNSEKYKSRY